MDVNDFRLLYDYNSWANHRTLDACGALTSEQFTSPIISSFSSVRDTLVHIRGAEWVWLERWHGRSPSSMGAVAADFPDLEAVRRAWDEVDRNLIDFVASLTPEDLQRTLSYKTMSGESHAQPHWQMLQHVANHSTYHRGQITTMLRQLGAKPVGTDLIAFYRMRAANPAA